MIIKNALLFTENQGFEKGNLRFHETIEELRFAPVSCSGKTAGTPMIRDDVLDAEGLTLVPGFIDIHTHGAIGMESGKCSPEEMQTLAEYYASQGTTSFCVTTMTQPAEALRNAAARVRDFVPAENAADCAGLYLEGPFLSLEKCGAQNPADLRLPDAELAAELYELSGRKLKVCAVAPELPGAESFIRKISQLCTVTLAHTASDYETASRAFACGATQVTHLFNAMPPLHHRNPGLIGAALDSNAQTELICDGVHIHPSVVRAAFTLFKNRIILISDSLLCTGMPDGKYNSGGQEILLEGGRALLPDGTLAGSVISMADAVKRAIRFGIAPEEAVCAATAAPARAIGAYGTIGCLRTGARADFCLMDRDWNPVRVFVRGREIRKK